MKTTFPPMIKSVGLALIAILLAVFTASTLQAQCCGGHGYQSFEPYYPPVYSYRQCLPPAWYYRGCTVPGPMRPYAGPPLARQPAPYGWETAPDDDSSIARGHHPQVPSRDTSPARPTSPHTIAPSESHLHELTESRAAVTSEAPSLAPSPYDLDGLAEPRARVSGGSRAIAPASPPSPAPADLRALAERQGTCPVTGAKLGSMGEPVKVRVKGRDVLLCCPGCVDRFKSDPDKYLVKLSP